LDQTEVQSPDGYQSFSIRPLRAFSRRSMPLVGHLPATPSWLTRKPDFQVFRFPLPRRTAFFWSGQLADRVAPKSRSTQKKLSQFLPPPSWSYYFVCTGFSPFIRRDEFT